MLPTTRTQQFPAKQQSYSSRSSSSNSSSNSTNNQSMCKIPQENKTQQVFMICCLTPVSTYMPMVPLLKSLDPYSPHGHGRRQQHPKVPVYETHKQYEHTFDSDQAVARRVFVWKMGNRVLACAQQILQLLKRKSAESQLLCNHASSSAVN